MIHCYMFSLPVAENTTGAKFGTKFQSTALALSIIHDTDGFCLPEEYRAPGQVC